MYLYKNNQEVQQLQHMPILKKELIKYLDNVLNMSVLWIIFEFW